MPMTDELREKLGVPKPPPKKALPEVEVTETCPKCNGPMKLRQGPRGVPGVHGVPEVQGRARGPGGVGGAGGDGRVMAER